MKHKNKTVHADVINAARQKIGELIRISRNEAGLSQAALAEIANVRQATVHKLESGNEVNISTLIAVVAALNGRIIIEVD